MKKSQYNSPSHIPYQTKKFGDELTTRLILVCVGSAIGLGACLVFLMKWLG